MLYFKGVLVCDPVYIQQNGLGDRGFNYHIGALTRGQISISGWGEGYKGILKSKLLNKSQ